MNRFLERFGDKALEKFLSSQEILLVKNYKTAAGFWAVKEACSKALGVGIGSECGFHDIIITKSPKGAPNINFSASLIQKFHISHSSVSITHDGDYAIAIVALEKSSATDKIKEF